MPTNKTLSLKRNPNDNKLTSGFNPNVGYDVYWLIGQSNMIGRAAIRTGIDDDYSAISGKVFQFGYNSQTVSAATNPLDHVNENAGQMGLWLEFIKPKVAGLTGSRQILLVPSAQGGTGFATNNWNPGNTLNNAAKARLTSAMTQGSGYNVYKGAVWLQGETDADSGASAAANYLTAVQAMYDNFVSTLSAQGFTASKPFIVGSIKPDKPNASTINTALQTFATNNAAVEYVNLTDLTFLDADHYDAPSLFTAGQRYSNAFV